MKKVAHQLDWPWVGHPSLSCSITEGIRVPWKNLFFLALSPEGMTHFRGFWGDFRESYILLHVLSKLPIVLLVLLALSVGVVVQAWVGIATESTPWSEKLAVRVGMSGMYFGKRCICHVRFKGSLSLSSREVLHYNTLALILIAAFSRKHEQGYKFKWNIYLSAV